MILLMRLNGLDNTENVNKNASRTMDHSMSGMQSMEVLADQFGRTRNLQDEIEAVSGQMFSMKDETEKCMEAMDTTQDVFRQINEEIGKIGKSIQPGYSE